MPTKPNTPTLAEAQDALAAMKVACPNGYRQLGTLTHDRDCICQGSGTRPRFPALRVACPRNKDSHASFQGLRGISDPYRTCDRCGLVGHGKHWVPNRDWAALRQAAREAGWEFSTGTGSGDQGDGVTLVEREIAHRPDVWRVIAHVSGGGTKDEYDEGLRGQHAETVAMWRAAGLNVPQELERGPSGNQ